MTTQLPVAFGGYYNLTNLVNDTVNEILHQRNTVPVKITEMEKGATITVDELDAALTRLGYGAADLLVGSIYKSVVEHREPEWKAGDVVKDAAGTLYRRTSHGGWRTFGTTETYTHEYPARPLKKIDT